MERALRRYGVNSFFSDFSLKYGPINRIDPSARFFSSKDHPIMTDLADLSGNAISLDHTFLVQKAIHRGTMATLYTATWHPFEIPVFIRSYESLIKLRLRHRDTARIKRFITTKAGFLRGPNLPDIIDIGEEDAARPFLICRLQEGKLLLHKIDEEGAVSVEKTLQIIKGVANALKIYREADEPHRGPTVDRIWIANDGTPTLLGAGEVLYRDDTISMSGLATTQLVWHIPPESFFRSISDNDKNVSSGEEEKAGSTLTIKTKAALQGRVLEDSLEAEVYVLAALAFHCIAGHHPFFYHRIDPSDGIVATMTDDLLDIPSLTQETKHKKIQKILAKGLARDPSERFENINTFIEAFSAVCEPKISIKQNISGELTAEVEQEEPIEEITVSKTTSSLEIKLWRWTSFFLAIGLIGYAVLDYLTPNSIIITSSPPNLELAEVTGHTSTPLGPTPIILQDRSLITPIELRVIGPNGELGPPTRDRPNVFQDLGRCRRLAVELAFDETQ